MHCWDGAQQSWPAKPHGLVHTALTDRRRSATEGYEVKMFLRIADLDVIRLVFNNISLVGIPVGGCAFHLPRTPPPSGLTSVAAVVRLPIHIWLDAAASLH